MDANYDLNMAVRSTARSIARQTVRVLWVAVGTLVLANPSAAVDGRLLKSREVHLTSEEIARLERIEPELGSMLETVEVRAITYSSGGLRVTGYLAVPRAGEALPGVIFNRGGNREFGVLDDRRAALLLAPIASWGYVVAAGNYRGNGGGEGREEFGGADVDEVLNLVPLLEGQPRVDATRLGMIGWSRGGMMTCLALARTDRFSAAILGSSALDLHRLLAERPEFDPQVFSQLIPGYGDSPSASRAALDQRSPVRWAERLPESTPILLLHGAEDDKVSPRDSIDLAARLLELDRPFRLVLFEGAGHGLREHRPEVGRLLRDWLDRFVRDGELPAGDPED